MKAYFASQISTADYVKKVESFYNKLTAEQYSSILYYSDSGHKRVNYASSASGKAVAEDICSALNQSTKEFKTVYRASDDFLLDELKVGETVAFPAFVSTSYNPQTTFKFLNKSQPIIYVIKTLHGAEISLVHDEMEVLLPKGLSFNIVNIETCDFYAAYPDTDYHVSRENVTVVYLEEK